MNNKTFIDSSTANRTINVIGNDVAQCSKCPNPPGAGVAYSAATHGASVYLKGGANNYVDTTLTTNWLNIGTGDFTMSCWLFPTSAAASWGNTIFRWGSWNIYRITSTGGISWGNDGFGVASTPANTCPLNTWTHFAASRVSGTLRLFINGNLVSTVANSSDYTVSTGTFGVGMYGPTNNWGGFISGVHVVVGTGLYTANFTPEVVPTAVANTRLLLKFDNIGLHDATTKSPLITMGGVVRSSTQVKYGSNSLYFPGTVNDYAYVPPNVNSLLAVGAGDFTMEMWVNPSGGAGSVRILAQLGAPFFNIHINSSNRFTYSINDSIIQSDATTTITYGQWYHLALTRSGTTVRFFVNGVQKGSASSSLNSSTGQLYLGRFSSSALYPFFGYIDDFRVTTGIARYTSDFTPPLELPKF